MELLNFICKCCTAPLDPAAAEGRTIRCSHCGTVFVMAKSSEPKLQSFLNQGEHDLDTGKFDDAFAAYKKASEIDRAEPEAYFGMALASFKIQYLKDEVNQRLQPICHETTDEKFSESTNFLRAIRYATNEQREEYERKGEEIDYILGEFYRLGREGLDYDCFLCVKVTDDETKLRTADYKAADDLYFQLKGKGYKPFFSERELGKVTGADYEARILYALCKSECMLVICGREEYLNTPWVKNEYTRFLKLVNDEEKESDSIAVAFTGKPVERLPGRKGKLQGIDLSKLDALTLIENFVEAHTPAARARKEEEARRAAEEAERREEEAKQRFREEQKKEQQEFQRQILKQVRSVSGTESGGSGATVSSLLLRAEQELDDSQFETAEKYFNEVLERDPVNGEAWWGTFLCKRRATSENVLLSRMNAELYEDILDDRYFRNALQYALDETKVRVDRFDATINGGNLWWRIFLRSQNAQKPEDLLRGLNEARAGQLEKDANFVRAEEFADEELQKTIDDFRENVLHNAAAYWTAFLADFGAKHEDEIAYNLEKVTEIANDPNYRLALKYADDELGARLEAFRTRMAGEAESAAAVREIALKEIAKKGVKYPSELRQSIEKKKKDVEKAKADIQKTKEMREEWEKISDKAGSIFTAFLCFSCFAFTIAFEVLFNFYYNFDWKITISIFGGIGAFVLGAGFGAMFGMMVIIQPYCNSKKKGLAAKYRLPLSDLSDKALASTPDPADQTKRIYKNEPGAVARLKEEQKKLKDLETKYKVAVDNFSDGCKECMRHRQTERCLSGQPVSFGPAEAELLSKEVREYYLSLTSR